MLVFPAGKYCFCQDALKWFGNKTEVEEEESGSASDSCSVFEQSLGWEGVENT